MADETAVKPVIGAELRSHEIDGAFAALAERQHGVVARVQLAGLGIGRRVIGHRLHTGRLHPLHRGVYAVGHRVVTREGRWMAAVLAVGQRAVLSHRSAAALWGMRATTRGRVEVTVPRKLKSRSAIEVHVTRLSDDEITVLRGIRITTPTRTLLDLAAVLNAQLERAINEAEYLRLTDAASLGDLVEHNRGRPGAGMIRELLATHNLGATITRSELETRFLAFLDEAVLPRPKVNANIKAQDRWIEADCVWPDRRVIAELDGHASHATTAGFERDRARDRALQAAGWRVIRITWRQLHEEPTAVARDLERLLRARGVT